MQFIVVKLMGREPNFKTSELRMASNRFSRNLISLILCGPRGGYLRPPFNVSVTRLKSLGGTFALQAELYANFYINENSCRDRTRITYLPGNLSLRAFGELYAWVAPQARAASKTLRFSWVQPTVIIGSLS